MVYDHKLHAPLKQQCTACHTGAKTAERAALPSSERCSLCHPDRGLKVPARSEKRLKDFVVFSHATHHEAKVDCADCHGDVSRGTVLKQLSMKSCVDCHKARQATVQCNVCHELSQ